jgi:1,4-alpha-glucan branching enzyme
MIEKKPSPNGKSVRVKFELPGDTATDSVYVVGDFNEWSESDHPMKYVKSRNVWNATVSLEPGRSYQFRYLIDGDQWQNDEEADGLEPSPYFSENSVIRL